MKRVLPPNFRARLCAALLAAPPFFCGAQARAQAPAAESKQGATISGRVTTADGKAAKGVVVGAFPQDYRPRQRLIARAETDADGRYALTNLPAGRLHVLPFAPAYNIPDVNASWPPGRPVEVGPGDRVEDMDFSLERGGVITGRVTDPEGKPVVGAQVTLTEVHEAGARVRIFTWMRYDATDDRGVYRIYGLPPGRYKVGVGEGMGMVYSGGRRPYTRTFHPDATDEAQAKAVEVTAGEETNGIDIALASAAKTYRLTGRVVDAETGQPAAGVLVSFGSLDKSGTHIAETFGGAPSDARGEFRLNMMPGRYVLFVEPHPQLETYSEPLTFELADSDVSGLEVKLRRGATVSGVMVMEGAADREALAQLARMRVAAALRPREGQQQQIYAPYTHQAKVNPDGSFTVTGLPPGKVQIFTATWPPPKGVMMLRVERGGADVREGFEVAAGEHVTGVRVVFGYGTGIIRGQVKIEGGTLPAGAFLFVHARHIGGDPNTSHHRAQVDARGRFSFEGLLPGQYELRLDLYDGRGGVRPGASDATRQTVSVSNGTETSVAFVYSIH